MEQARHFLTQFSGPESYVVFYFLLAGCGIGLPFNSDLILISASVLAALGYFKLAFLIPIAFFGLLTGDTINFFVARRYGKKLLTIAPFKWIVSSKKVSAAETYLATKGNRFLFCVRFLPLIRTALYFTAGSLQVRPKTFYWLDCLSTSIYLMTLMNIAFYAGENIETLLPLFRQFQFVLLAIFVIFVTAFVVRNKTKGLHLA